MSKSKRIKIKNLAALATRAEAETIMNEVALTLNNQRRITASMEARVLKVREEYAAALGLCAEGVALGTERLKLWAVANPAEFAKVRSVQFPAGTVGFRTGMPKLALLNRKFTWRMALEAVQGLIPNFIRSKPEIDAEAIVSQREDEGIRFALQRCGLKVVQEETFFVEAKLEKMETRIAAKNAEGAKEAA